jgi:hypothetical protein
LIIATDGGILNVADVTADHARIDPPDGGPCNIDASEGSACPLPPSICVDPHWLAYFVNPVCSATGSCEWEIRYRECVSCLGSGCRTNITL